MTKHFLSINVHFEALLPRMIIFVTQDIKFPMSLDVFDLCTEELQNKLIPIRSKFKEEEDKQAERVLKVSTFLYYLMKYYCRIGFVRTVMQKSYIASKHKESQIVP